MKEGICMKEGFTIKMVKTQLGIAKEIFYYKSFLDRKSSFLKKKKNHSFEEKIHFLDI